MTWFAHRKWFVSHEFYRTSWHCSHFITGHELVTLVLSHFFFFFVSWKFSCCVSNVHLITHTHQHGAPYRIKDAVFSSDALWRAFPMSPTKAILNQWALKSLHWSIHGLLFRCQKSLCSCEFQRIALKDTTCLITLTYSEVWHTCMHNVP